MFDVSRDLIIPSQSITQELISKDSKPVETEVQNYTPTKDIQMGESSKSESDEVVKEGDNQKSGEYENSGVSELSQAVQELTKKDEEVVLRSSTRNRKPRKLFTP